MEKSPKLKDIETEIKILQKKRKNKHIRETIIPQHDKKIKTKTKKEQRWWRLYWYHKRTRQWGVNITLGGKEEVGEVGHIPIVAEIVVVRKASGWSTSVASVDSIVPPIRENF